MPVPWGLQEGCEAVTCVCCCLSVRGHMRSSPVHLYYNNWCYSIFTSKHTHTHTHIATSLLHKQTTCYCAHTLCTKPVWPHQTRRSTNHRHIAAHEHANSPCLEGLGLSGPVFVCYCTPRGNVQAAELGQYSPGNEGIHTGDCVPVTQQKEGGMYGDATNASTYMCEGEGQRPNRQRVCQQHGHQTAPQLHPTRQA